jgi:hypothetical protein
VEKMEDSGKLSDLQLANAELAQEISKLQKQLKLLENINTEYKQLKEEAQRELERMKREYSQKFLDLERLLHLKQVMISYVKLKL